MFLNIFLVVEQLYGKYIYLNLATCKYMFHVLGQLFLLLFVYEPYMSVNRNYFIQRYPVLIKV